ncbi:MAG: hypothetical protein WD029_05455 [Microthrixaceae bacterium]
MSIPEHPWSAPGTQISGTAGSPPEVSFMQGSPLGGAVPVAVTVPAKSDRRDLLLTAALLVLALLAGASSLLPWRDYAFRYGTRALETGWAGANGGLGRGWITVLGAVLLAVAGVLIAAERGRAGRVLAVLTGLALVVVAIAEWGLGAGGSRSGPGTGIWLEFVVGITAVLVVGVLGPADPAK